MDTDFCCSSMKSTFSCRSIRSHISLSIIAVTVFADIILNWSLTDGKSLFRSTITTGLLSALSWFLSRTSLFIASVQYSGATLPSSKNCFNILADVANEGCSLRESPGTIWKFHRLLSPYSPERLIRPAVWIVLSRLQYSLTAVRNEKSIPASTHEVATNVQSLSPGLL